MKIDEDGNRNDGDDNHTVTESDTEIRTDKFHNWRNEKYDLPLSYRLRTEHNAKKKSLHSIYFAIVVGAVNIKMLIPNYALMCAPDATSDSFPSTKPFGFNAATYFLPMTTLLGVALSSVFVGKFSDKFGRKKVMLILSWMSAVGAIAKYLVRGTFWGFSVASFVSGLFLGNLPVGMAYIGDIESDKRKKEDFLGTLVGCYIFGGSGGGIVAVLMNDTGLFSPLWVGAGAMVLSSIFLHVFMIEAGHDFLEVADATVNLLGDENDDNEDQQRPDTIDKKTMWNILIGALLDNIGSNGLFPLCLSPLALEAFFESFISEGKNPIMSVSAYQWLSVCVSLLIVPATQMSPFVFSKMGVAGTCVFGNAVAATVMGLLLWIGNLPPTNATFGVFIFVFYTGFPVTIFSQLTTGPMLDVIAPEDKIGYVQGLNISVMNIGMALAPWIFGLVADAAGSNIAIATAISSSILAATVNSPLMFHPQMGRPVPKLPIEKRPLEGEDDDMVSRILDGSYVDPEILFEINRERGMNRRPGLVPRVKSYNEDKENMVELTKNARAAFRFRMEVQDHILSDYADAERDPDNAKFTKQELCDIINAVRSADQSLIDQSTSDLGQWMGQYLDKNGYHPYGTSLLIKQMFMSAFPPVTEERQLTPENIHEIMLREKMVMTRFVRQEEEEQERRRKKSGTPRLSLSQLLSKSAAVTFYS